VERCERAGRRPRQNPGGGPPPARRGQEILLSIRVPGTAKVLFQSMIASKPMLISREKTRRKQKRENKRKNKREEKEARPPSFFSRPPDTPTHYTVRYCTIVTKYLLPPSFRIHRTCSSWPRRSFSRRTVTSRGRCWRRSWRAESVRESESETLKIRIVNSFEGVASLQAHGLLAHPILPFFALSFHVHSSSSFNNIHSGRERCKKVCWPRAGPDRRAQEELTRCSEVLLQLEEKAAASPNPVAWEGPLQVRIYTYRRLMT
jgi:hypothetical protein